MAKGPRTNTEEIDARRTEASQSGSGGRNAIGRSFFTQRALGVEGTVLDGSIVQSYPLPAVLGPRLNCAMPLSRTVLSRPLVSADRRLDAG